MIEIDDIVTLPNSKNNNGRKFRVITIHKNNEGKVYSYLVVMLHRDERKGNTVHYETVKPINILLHKKNKRHIFKQEEQKEMLNIDI